MQHKKYKIKMIIIKQIRNQISNKLQNLKKLITKYYLFKKGV